MSWQTYAVTLAVGVGVGALYGLLQVRTPAPPIIALVGLLGILAGEQIPPVVKRFIAGERLDAALLRHQCGAHLLGALPGRTGRPRSE